MTPRIASKTIGSIRLAAVALFALLAGCGGVDGTSTADPHPPRTDDERFLVKRFDGFVSTLRRGDTTFGSFRIPRKIRATGELSDEVFAVSDPYYNGNEIQISAEVLSTEIAGQRGSRLIVFFRRSGDGWRVRDAIFGAYG